MSERGKIRFKVTRGPEEKRIEVFIGLWWVLGAALVALGLILALAMH